MGWVGSRKGQTGRKALVVQELQGVQTGEGQISGGAGTGGVEAWGCRWYEESAGAHRQCGKGSKGQGADVRPFDSPAAYPTVPSTSTIACPVALVAQFYRLKQGFQPF